MAEDHRSTDTSTTRPPKLRVIPYFSPASETTTYLVSPRDASDVVLVDPVQMDRGLYRLILAQHVRVRAVLVTHLEAYMYRALRTLRKIYDFELFTGAPQLQGSNTTSLEDERTFRCCDLTVHAIPILPHSRGSYLYHIDDLVFTGSVVHAGTLGETANAFAEALLVAAVKDYLFSLDEHTVLLPSVGPPSTLAAERGLSPYYREDR